MSAASSGGHICSGQVGAADDFPHRLPHPTPSCAAVLQYQRDLAAGCVQLGQLQAAAAGMHPGRVDGSAKQSGAATHAPTGSSGTSGTSKGSGSQAGSRNDSEGPARTGGMRQGQQDGASGGASRPQRRQSSGAATVQAPCVAAAPVPAGWQQRELPAWQRLARQQSERWQAGQLRAAAS
jgi:hypothetical protein